MKKGPELLLTVLVLAVVAVFAGLMFAPSSAIYSWLFTVGVRDRMASLTKLLLLFLGLGVSLRVAQRFDRGSLVRRGWSFLTMGFLGFGLGQLALAPYQLFGDGSTPFPSPADFFFLLGYPFFAAALFVFVRAYAEAGYPVGSASARRLVMVGVALVCSALAYPLLRPVVQASASSPWALFLTLAYPILDFILLLPLVLLLRITWAFRGGEVAAVWRNILIGFVFVSAADILFGYFQAKGYTHIDPMVHASYIVSYWLMARGVLRQLALTHSD